MELRTPRTEVKLRGYWADTLALCHPKMLIVVACILSVGHLLSPRPLDPTRYALGLIGVLLALQGIYRYNELTDFRRGAIPRNHHVVIGTTLLLAGILIGVYLSVRYAWWIAMLLVVGAGGMLAYNLLRTRMIHNRVVYSAIWGGFPLYASYSLQTLNPVPPVGVVAWAVFFSVVSVEVLWTWGPVGCRYQGVCKRVRPDKICHSPNMTCKDREDIPKSVRVHTRLMLSMKAVSMVMLTIAVFLMRGG